MRPLPYAWPYALIFWGVFIWAFAPEFSIIRRARREQTSSDSKSLQVIMIGQSMAYFIAYPIAWVPALQFPPAYRLPSFVVGLVTIVAGTLLRRHCFRMLGGSFTGDVRARSDEEVVSGGAYRFLRHPSYTGGILLNAGVGIALGSWASALLLASATVFVYAYRMS